MKRPESPALDPLGTRGERAARLHEAARRSAADGDHRLAVLQRREAERLFAPPVGLAPAAGNELAVPGASPLVDTLADPKSVNVDAAEHRVELAEFAGAGALGLDMAETVDAQNSAEKILAHQAAAAHALAMRLMGRALIELNGGRPEGAAQEASRLAVTASKLMAASQGALATIHRLRHGGQQTVLVQRVDVSVNSEDRNDGRG